MCAFGLQVTILDVARHLNVIWHIVKHIQKRDLGRRYAKPKLTHLRQIAIDETPLPRDIAT